MKTETAVIQIPTTFYLGMYRFDSIEAIAKGESAPILSTTPWEDVDWGESKFKPFTAGTATVAISLYTQDKITASQVAALQEQLRQHRINAERAERAILDQISNLQALTFEG